MAKGSLIGVDIGHDQLKFVLIKNGHVEKVIVEEMPDNMLVEGKIVSPEAMGQHLGELLKKHNIKTKEAALVLNEQTAIIRVTDMPKMTESQLLYNLPYEFKDYITEEIQKYLFDYAILQENKNNFIEEITQEDENTSETAEQMEVLGVAVLKSDMENLRYMFKKAGLKLTGAAPAISGYAAIIRRLSEKNENKEYCFLDIGYESIRIHIFEGDMFKVTRSLESGLSDLIHVIADQFGVDNSVAHSYMISNHEQCLNQAVCREVYSRIETEIMRVIHFYQFSNPDSSLQEIWICGGGAAMDELYHTISDNDEMIVHRANSLIQDISANPEECDLAIAAIGVALQ